jgi:hypothetical protein
MVRRFGLRVNGGGYWRAGNALLNESDDLDDHSAAMYAQHRRPRPQGVVVLGIVKMLPINPRPTAFAVRFFSSLLARLAAGHRAIWDKSAAGRGDEFLSSTGGTFLEGNAENRRFCSGSRIPESLDLFDRRRRVK